MKVLVFAVLTVFNLSNALAEDLKTVDVEGIAPIANTVSPDQTSSLLEDSSGLSLRKAGGLADSPSIHGFSNDRVNIKVDGSIMTNSCPNHMNPALSFVHPDQVSGIHTFEGLDPVSNGGDNIAGSVIVSTKKAKFSEGTIDQGLRLRTFYRSNNFNSGAALSTHIASLNYFFSYEGIQEKAGRYLDGNHNRLKGTLYEQNNQSITLARKINNGDVTLKLSRSNIPYQGFVNQYMDLVGNQTDKAHLALNKTWNKLKLEILSSFTHTDHSMNKLSSERAGNMPMDTKSDEFNTSAKFNYDEHLNFGFEYFQYRLEDWWDPVMPGGMMGPNVYQNVHLGKRDRIGAYVENTFNKGERIEYLTGLRSDVVFMNTGRVEGYNNTSNSPVDAAFFNSQDRKKTDLNFDALLAVRIKKDEKQTIETGYARKTRSPNMYERYSWGGLKTRSMGTRMDMRMINWFGDGNGYVGDVDLKPEVAHKFSMKYSYNDKNRFKFEVSPFFNYVESFIDANVLERVNGIHYLQFANEDAVLYGFDFNADVALFSSRKLGDYSLRTVGSYTRGYRVDKQADLYHLMPLNMNTTLRHQLSIWENDLTLRLVSQKKTVNKLRREAETAGYGLLDFATRLKWSKFTWELGVSNILNKDYQMPLAGLDLVNYSSANRVAQFGMGRSYNTSFIMEF